MSQIDIVEITDEQTKEAYSKLIACAKNMTLLAIRTGELLIACSGSKFKYAECGCKNAAELCLKVFGVTYSTVSRYAAVAKRKNFYQLTDDEVCHHSIANLYYILETSNDVMEIRELLKKPSYEVTRMRTSKSMSLKDNTITKKTRTFFCKLYEDQLSIVDAAFGKFQKIYNVRDPSFGTRALFLESLAAEFLNQPEIKQIEDLEQLK